MAGRTLRKVILVILVLVIGLIVLMYVYLKSQLTVPVEATSGTLQPLPEAGRAGEIIRNYRQEFQRESRLVLNEEDVSRLIAAAVRQHLRDSAARLIRAVQTEIQPNGMRIELVLNLRNAPRDQFPPEVNNALQVYEKMFGQKALENFRVEVSGSPRMINNRLQFSEDARIQIAGFSLPMNVVLEESRTWMDLEKQLQLALPFRHIELYEGYLIITQ